MKKKNGVALPTLMSGLMMGLVTTAAIANPSPTDPNAASSSSSATPKKKKPVLRKSISRKGAVTRREAKEDHLTTPQSSSISAATATTSMPGLTAGSSTSEAPAAFKKKKWTDNLRAGILFEYTGASVADPLSGRQTDKSTGYSQGNYAQELDTRMTLGYALTDNVTFSLNGYFWSYGDSLAGGGHDGEKFQFRPGDSFLAFNVAKFVQVGRFKWSGDFRFYPGLGSDYDRRILYFRTGQNLSYSLTPRLNLAMYNTLRYYFNTQSAYNVDHDPTGNRIDSRATFGPAIEYQLLDHAGVSLSFNTEYAHTHTNNTITPTENVYASDFTRPYFEVGALIDVTKFISLNPYVDMFTNIMNVEGMQFGGNLHITIL